MATKKVLILLIFSTVAICQCASIQSHIAEARGKKKKIGALIFFADIVLKKLFVLKLVYAFILWCVIHKAGYFLAWFVSYLKEKKHEHHDHHDHDHHDHSYHDHNPHNHGHIDYGHYDSYGPYRKSYKINYNVASNKKSF